jgi:probable F420-dependent oxidoreductase
MLLDCNIGGAVDGTPGGDLAVVQNQVAEAWRLGYDGVWSTEVGRDPFLPLMIACRAAPTLQLGTAVAIAFARNPMTVAVTANDLQAYSGGRFTLGLGSQVKAHVTRRYGMPWSEPAERMREFIAAVRAIWACWQDESPLRFEGRFYEHTLMTPMFRPAPHEWGPPPVVLAAVGPRMLDVAATAADGVLLHSFLTERYLDEKVLPVLEAGLAASHRTRAELTINLPGLVATGSCDQELLMAMDTVRAQVAFYGATPAYRGVLELHGLGDLHEELHRLSTKGEWDTMTSLVDDETLCLFAVVGTPAEAGAEIRRRFGGTVDRFTVSTPYPLSLEARRGLTAAVRG